VDIDKIKGLGTTYFNVGLLSLSFKKKKRKKKEAGVSDEI